MIEPSDKPSHQLAPVAVLRYEKGFRCFGRVWWREVTREKFLLSLKRDGVFTRWDHPDSVLAVLSVSGPLSIGRSLYRIIT